MKADELRRLLKQLDGLFAEAAELRFASSRLVTGRYFGATITSVFQPIGSAVNGEVVAQEALARSYSRTGDGLSPWRLFGAVADGEPLVRLDRLCRAVHVLNFLAGGGHRKDEWLFLNVHERLLHTVADGHGAFFREVLARVGVPASRIVIDIPRLRSQDIHVLRRAASNYRAAGFRVAVVAESVVEARLLGGWIEPDFIRLDASVLRGNSPTAEISPLRPGGASVIATRIETAAERSRAISAGASLLQGFAIGRPGAVAALVGGRRPGAVSTVAAPGFGAMA